MLRLETLVFNWCWDLRQYFLSCCMTVVLWFSQTSWGFRNFDTVMLYFGTCKHRGKITKNSPCFRCFALRQKMAKKRNHFREGGRTHKVKIETWLSDKKSDQDWDDIFIVVEGENWMVWRGYPTAVVQIQCQLNVILLRQKIKKIHAVDSIATNEWWRFKIAIN
jgi:hypothetical protein